MPARRAAVLGAAAGLLVALAVGALVVLVPVRAPAAAAARAEPSPPATTVVADIAASPTTVLDNDFVPEDRDLSECISALPRPGCGSKARGGWRQTLVFLVVVVGLAFIAWRIIRSARRKRPDPADREVQNA